jgi:acyl dehydratase
MLDQSAVGLSLSQSFSYDWRDIILYHLSVGAQQEELEYVYEEGLKVLPTFGVIPCFSTFKIEPACSRPQLPTHFIQGLRPEGTLHMDHKLMVHKQLSPIGGCLHVDKIIREVYDRGADKGAKIIIEIKVCDEKGEPVFTNVMGYFNRFAGGFGGEKPPACDVAIPSGAPDLTVKSHFDANAPLLYRLTGDTFPLHADPDFARKCGFERPIMHGLCSFGYVCRLLIGALFPHEPERMVSLETQFRSVAYPGDGFIVEIWRTGRGEAVYRMQNKVNRKSVLDFGRIIWN